MACAEKTLRLKQAKAEASVEVETYKTQREAQFQIFSKERMGDTSTHSMDLKKSSEAELSGIAGAVATNKAVVIDLLLKAVKTVSK